MLSQVDLAEKWMSYTDHDGTPLNTRIHWAKESPRSITVGEFSSHTVYKQWCHRILISRQARWQVHRMLTSSPLPLAPRRQVEIIWTSKITIAKPYQLNIKQRSCTNVNSPYQRKCCTNWVGHLYQSLLWGQSPNLYFFKEPRSRFPGSLKAVLRSGQCCGTVTIFYGSGSCSGSYFWKVMVPVPAPTFEKVMVPVPVPVRTFEKLRFRFRFQLHI